MQFIIIQNNVFFLNDGPGGTGKTFLYNTVLASVRAKKDIAKYSHYLIYFVRSTGQRLVIIKS
jgi:hypothetical protein